MRRSEPIGKSRPCSESSSFIRRNASVDAAPSDSLAPPGAISSGSTPAAVVNLSSSSPRAAPGCGTVTTVTLSAAFPQAPAIRDRSCWRQKVRPASVISSGSCHGQASRTPATYSGQVQLRPFWMVSCHSAAMLRLRSRAVTTTSTRAGASDADQGVGSPVGPAGPRNSMDTTAVPLHRRSAWRARSHDPSWFPSRRRPSETAVTWSAHLAPGTSVPRSRTSTGGRTAAAG